MVGNVTPILKSGEQNWTHISVQFICKITIPLLKSTRGLGTKAFPFCPRVVSDIEQIFSVWVSVSLLQ